MRFSIAVTVPGETPRRSASAEVPTGPPLAWRGRRSPSRSPRSPRCRRRARPGCADAGGWPSDVDQEPGQVEGECARGDRGRVRRVEHPATESRIAGRSGRSPGRSRRPPLRAGTPSSALSIDAPISAPRIAGAPAIRPRPSSRAGVTRSRISGATIATPSVVLWIAKPTTRKAPSASSPTAYAEPIASPRRGCGGRSRSRPSARAGIRASRRPPRLAAALQVTVEAGEREEREWRPKRRARHRRRPLPTRPPGPDPRGRRPRRGSPAGRR